MDRKVVASRKYREEPGGRRPLTECTFDQEGRKDSALIHPEDGSPSYRLKIEYFTWGDREIATFLSGEKKYTLEFRSQSPDTSSLSFFSGTDELVVQYVIGRTELHETRFARDTRLTETMVRAVDHSRQSIEFLYEDFEKITARVYSVERAESPGKQDFQILTSLNQQLLDYYENDRTRKIREVWEEGRICARYVTEIQYRESPEPP